MVVPNSLANGNNNGAQAANYLAPNRASSAKERLLSVPRSFARYFFPNMRVRVPMNSDESQSSSQASFSDFKRSSSALDALTGVTLAGKRSVDSYAPGGGAASGQYVKSLVNYEPLLSKPSSMYSNWRPRDLDMDRIWCNSIGCYVF